MSLEEEIRRKQGMMEQQNRKQKEQKDMEKLMHEASRTYNFPLYSPVLVEPWPELRAIIDEARGEMTFDRPKIVRTMPNGIMLVKTPMNRHYLTHNFVKEKENAYSFDVLVGESRNEHFVSLWVFQNGTVAFINGNSNCPRDELLASNITDEVIREKIIECIARRRIAANSQDASDSSRRRGCYIATAVYGSYDCSEVWVLRRYRDNYLITNSLGRLFVKVYYAVSPTVVRLFGNQKWFNHFWRKFLDKKVQKLKKDGLSDEKYNDIA